MHFSETVREVESKQIVQGAIVGLIGGLVGTWVMTRFQSLMSSLPGEDKSQESKHSQEAAQQPSATEQVADVVSELLRGRPVSQGHKPLAGLIVHYGYGTLMGGLYGVVRQVIPPARRLAGLPWGVALWVGGDEIALPLLKLSGPPNQYALSTHATALAAHLVYAAATEAVCLGADQAVQQGIEMPRPIRRIRREEPARLDYAEFIATGR